MVIFFGIPHVIFKKFEKNIYGVFIAVLCFMLGLLLAIMADFFYTPRSYGYIPADDVTIYDLMENSDYTGF
jgi:hypothetical protein